MNSYKVATFAGIFEEFGVKDGHRLSSTFKFPQGICTDKKGALYVADSNSIRVIRGVQVTSITTVQSFGICVGKDGNLYFTDYWNHTVCKIMDGEVKVVAGIRGTRGSDDGPQGTLDRPYGIVEGEEGEFYVTCRGNGTVRKVSKDGSLSTLCSGLGLRLPEEGPRGSPRIPLGTCMLPNLLEVV